MARAVYQTGYSPVGDLIVVAIGYVMIILMVFSYINKTRAFRIFLSTVAMVMLAAMTDVGFNMLTKAGRPEHLTLIFILRCAFHFFLFGIFQMFVIYIAEVTRLDRRRSLIFALLGALILVIVMAMDVADTLRGQSVIRTADGYAFQGRGVFFYGYLAYVTLIVVEMFLIRKRLFRRVMLGFYGTMAVSFIMLAVSKVQNDSSFMVSTFLYPIIAMFYIMHSTPYDATLGAIDSRALQELVKHSYESGRDYMFMSLYMPAFDEEGKALPEAVRATMRRFTTDFFRSATLFMASAGHVMLVFPLNRNPDYEQRIQNILIAFQGEYHRFRYDYKIVIGNFIDEVSRKNEYVSFIRDIHRDMDMNSIRRVGPEDVKRFNSNEYVLHELEDIYNRQDLDDGRVLCYCQPVFNIKTGKYDTAEALMRLKLEKQGLVFPDQFIPLAEENGYIHVLTEIILNKACKAVHRLVEQGFDVARVSVNVSVQELRDDRFCDDITRIIRRNDLEGEKIAIALTESMTDDDFILMKNKISELRQKGIKFYLDDFGTGYSNMERIMELPFDIIKFDRSMVMACGINERSRRIVVNLANMLAEMNYAVLFEGVEKDTDEAMCVSMSASYLQGYKYSKPVPIERLQYFFEHKSA